MYVYNYILYHKDEDEVSQVIAGTIDAQVSHSYLTPIFLVPEKS